MPPFINLQHPAAYVVWHILWVAWSFSVLIYGIVCFTDLLAARCSERYARGPCNRLYMAYIHGRWDWKMVAKMYTLEIRCEREREVKFICLFGDRGHRGPYSPYKPCNHNLYIGIIIFPHIDNPQSKGYNQPKKKTIKTINEKSEGPINLSNHWRKRLWISLYVDLKKLN